MKSEILIPNYYTNFSCVGGACEDTCCAGWKVTVDKKTYQKYRNVNTKGSLKNDLRKNITRERSNPSDANFAKIKMDEHFKCTFLSNDGWCKIHSELGENYLCNTCTVYPRHLNLVDDCTEKSLTPSCPVAARLILLNENGIDFIIDEENSNQKELISASIMSKYNPLFWDLRMFTIRVLQNRTQSLEVRLIILGLFLQKLDSISIKDWPSQLEGLMNNYERLFENKKEIEPLLDLPNNLSFQMNMVKNLLKYRISGGISSQRYLDCINDTLNGLQLNDDTEIEESIKNYNHSLTEFYKPFIDKHQYTLENYSVNYVFKNLFPYDQSNIFESFVMLVVNITMIKLHLIGMAKQHNGLTIDLLIKLIQSYSKTIEHNISFLNNVKDMLKESGYSTMAHMIVLIKS